MIKKMVKATISMLMVPNFMVILKMALEMDLEYIHMPIKMSMKVFGNKMLQKEKVPILTNQAIFTKESGSKVDHQD